MLRTIAAKQIGLFPNVVGIIYCWWCGKDTVHFYGKRADAKWQKEDQLICDDCGGIFNRYTVLGQKIN